MRVRRSTAGLATVFLVALVTYVFVRPEDPTATSQTVPVQVVPSPAAASPTPSTAPTPSEAPTPTDVPEPTAPSEEPPAVEPSASAGPVPEPTAGPTAPPEEVPSPEPSPEPSA